MIPYKAIPKLPPAIKTDFNTEKRLLVTYVGSKHALHLNIGDEIIAVNGLSVTYLLNNPVALLGLFDLALHQKKFLVLSCKTEQAFEIAFDKKYTPII